MKKTAQLLSISLLSPIVLLLGSANAFCEADAISQWKAFRSNYKTLEINGKNTCTYGNCITSAPRLDSNWWDPSTRKMIPQVMSWELLLWSYGDQYGGSSQSIEIPVFSDRGTFQTRGGVLVYDFSGNVGYESQHSNYTIHLELSNEESKTRLRAHLEISQGKYDYNALLEAIPGSHYDDPTPGLEAGKIAYYEISNRYQGYACTISYDPDSEDLLRAKRIAIVNGQKLPIDTIFYRRDPGMGSLTLKLRTSHSQTQANPSAGYLNYISVFGPSAEGGKEIPVLGEGSKVVTNDSDSKNEFATMVKNVCAFDQMASDTP